MNTLTVTGIIISTVTVLREVAPYFYCMWLHK